MNETPLDSKQAAKAVDMKWDAFRKHVSRGTGPKPDGQIGRNNYWYLSTLLDWESLVKTKQAPEPETAPPPVPRAPVVKPFAYGRGMPKGEVEVSEPEYAPIGSGDPDEGGWSGGA